MNERLDSKAVPNCSVCPEPVDVAEDGVLVVRHARRGDEPALADLYATLSPDDLTRRFFTAASPGEHFLERWATVDERGGCCLLVRGRPNSGGPETTIAEAGYAPLEDGDVELGITVRPDRRGWIGPWLLSVLLDHAAEAGFANMQAIVKTSNRSMLELLRRRNCIRFDDTDWGTTHVSVSTTGGTPGFPPNAARPRVLIESDRERPDAARRVGRRAGTMVICTGYGRPDANCPLHTGDRCPLIDEADAVVIDVASPDADDRSRSTDAAPRLGIERAIARVHGDTRVVSAESGSGELPIRRPPIDLGLDGSAEDLGP